MLENQEFIYICDIEDLVENKGSRFYINDTDIAVFKVNNNVYVLSNICPHQLAPAIYEGFVQDSCVVCPLHGWTFKLSDGKLHHGGRGLEAFPVKIENGKVYSKVYPKELNW